MKTISVLYAYTVKSITTCIPFLCILLPGHLPAKDNPYPTNMVAWGGMRLINQPVMSVAAGRFQSVALLEDSTAIVWGYDYNASDPVYTNIHAIASRSDQIIMLTGDGRVLCSDNQFDQRKKAENLTGVKAIAAGSQHVVVFYEDTLYAFGRDYEGQCAKLGKAKGIGAGVTHTLMITLEGTVYAFGDNSSDQCDVPPGLDSVIAVTGGCCYSVALRQNGSVVMWGYPIERQTEALEGLTNVTSIASGFDHVLALTGDGTVVAWGKNDSGQCDVPEGLTGVTAIAAGQCHSIACLSDGRVVTWGANGYRQCTPPIAHKTKAIAAGMLHALALREDGTVAAYGKNLDNQCNVPPDLTDVRSIAAGNRCSVALKEDGTLVQWGNGRKPLELTDVSMAAVGFNHVLVYLEDGSLKTWRGEGVLETLEEGADDIVDIAAGSLRSFALRSDGSVTAWDNYLTKRPDYVPDSLPDDIIEITAGSDHVVALRRDSTIFGWGSTAAFDTTPELSNVTAIAASEEVSLAFSRTTGLSIWGDIYVEANLQRELKNVVALAAGSSFGIAIIDDNNADITYAAPSSFQQNTPFMVTSDKKGFTLEWSGDNRYETYDLLGHRLTSKYSKRGNGGYSYIRSGTGIYIVKRTGTKNAPTHKMIFCR